MSNELSREMEEMHVMYNGADMSRTPICDPSIQMPRPVEIHLPLNELLNKSCDKCKQILKYMVIRE